MPFCALLLNVLRGERLCLTPKFAISLFSSVTKEKSQNQSLKLLQDQAKLSDKRGRINFKTEHNIIYLFPWSEEFWIVHCKMQINSQVLFCLNRQHFAMILIWWRWRWSILQHQWFIVSFLPWIQNLFGREDNLTTPTHILHLVNTGHVHSGHVLPHCIGAKYA